ncbi:MAG: macro domain-containing protein [Nitrospirae bacterium]|nr:macro domain-containing protein [Nitrospirota bacterium]
MLKEVGGDILLTKADALAHGVAPNDNFGNGLALALREQWPAMYKDFRHYSQTFSPKVGELWSWAGVGGVRIVNLFTQEAAVSHGSAHPGRATIENVNHCLKALVKAIETEKFTSIALPRLATGVGGLDWKDVKPLMEKHLGHLSIPVYVYASYQPGVQAAE